MSARRDDRVPQAVAASPSQTAASPLDGGAAVEFVDFAGAPKRATVAVRQSSSAYARCGCSAMLLGAFYFALDVKGWRRGTTFFRVIGMNALTIYLAQRVVDFGKVSAFLWGGAVRLLPPDGRPVGMALAYLATCWLLLYFLYRKGIFLKV